MKKFTFIIEREAFEGVRRVVTKLERDFIKVGGEEPERVVDYARSGDDFKIIFATIGRSEILKKLNFDASLIEGKQEVYQIKFIDDDALIVCGSDKRGTIYGMFALSEYIGVSPLWFWGDVEPLRKEIVIEKDIEVISKEPSIKYRGFFINDEWPCFGNWAFSHFDGFTYEMYDNVFELLLRLKGNYLWPAMWSSCFAFDGPDNINEVLADLYGVIMGTSHHEPCLRASEEWDKVRDKNSPNFKYGNEWNYYTNKEGLLKYWDAALMRSGRNENVVTIGMRGERDTSMLGEDSTLKENIDLLKDIITEQRKLIKKYCGDDKPQMLALYKEVEEYFYGDSANGVEGLKDWAELDDVICMLCEDNFGFMRTLPAPETRDRKGGWGMYYHFDYHGGPISYEFMPSITMEKTWEEMVKAYDYGIRDMWIVNVGDLKFNEAPLSYFMELAYDFETWGSNVEDKTLSVGRYWKSFIEKTFPSVAEDVRKNMNYVLQMYIEGNSMRRPEALNSEIYHPCHYEEASVQLAFAREIEKANEEVYSVLIDEKVKNAYYSLIYFPAKISLNLIKMHLYSGKNQHYAKQGKPVANLYADLVTDCIERDRELCQEFAEFRGGKWRGMEKEQHIGFTKWNEDGCKYPLRTYVEPFHKARLVVSRADREEIYQRTYGAPETIVIDDFLYAGKNSVNLEIANCGFGILEYKIEWETPCDWLELTTTSRLLMQEENKVDYMNLLNVSVIREKLTEEVNHARFLIKDKDTIVAVEVKARNIDTSNLPPMTFLEYNGVVAIEADLYKVRKYVNYNKDNYEHCGFEKLPAFGRSGAGMRVFPSTAEFSEGEEAPKLVYGFNLEEAGDYIIEVWTTPTNPVKINSPLRFTLNDKIITAVPATFKAGNNSDKEWQQGVLDNIRKTKIEAVSFDEGLNEITIGALEAGLILERILIYKASNPLLESYLGPPKGFYVD